MLAEYDEVAEQHHTEMATIRLALMGRRNVQAPPR
jgi:hypothetical protein